MANRRRISQIEPTLAFTEFDMIEKYRKSFERSELGHVHASFPFESLAKKMGLKESPYVGIGCQGCQRVFHHRSIFVVMHIAHEPSVQQAFLAFQLQGSMDLCQQGLDAVHITVHLLIGQANPFGIATFPLA